MGLLGNGFQGTKGRAVDIRVLGKEVHKRYPKDEVINSCSLEGSFVPTDPSNQAGVWRTEAP
jgi:hypothetical protein